MSSVEARLARLEQQVANLIRIGIIDQVSTAAAVPRARVSVGQLLTDWLPMPAIRAGGDLATWLLEEGEQVILLAPGGDLAQAVISHPVNTTGNPAVSSSAALARVQFSDGSIIQMDRSAGVLTLAPVEKLVVSADMELTGNLTHIGDYTITGDHTITGNTEITGDITQTGDHNLTGTVEADTDVIADGISLKGHQHTHGALAGTTSPPI